VEDIIVHLFKQNPQETRLVTILDLVTRLDLTVCLQLPFISLRMDMWTIGMVSVRVKCLFVIIMTIIYINIIVIIVKVNR